MVGGRTCKTVTRLRTFLLSRCTTPQWHHHHHSTRSCTEKCKGAAQHREGKGAAQHNTAGRPRAAGQAAEPVFPSRLPARLLHHALALPACCTLLRHVVVDQCSSGGVGSAWCLPLTPPSQSWQTTPPAFLHSDTLSAPVSSLKNLIRRWPSTSSSWWQAASPPSRHKVGSIVSTSNEEFPQELFLAASRDNVRPSTLHTMVRTNGQTPEEKENAMTRKGNANDICTYL